jgi:hypothetical protein
MLVSLSLRFATLAMMWQGESPMSNKVYDEILKRASDELNREELLRLSEQLTIRAVNKGPQKPRSLRELRGLGKEVWGDIDPDEYVAKERDSWDG